jgi:hypothetical protein
LALKAAGKQIPKPVFAQAEIDTGASCTVIDPSIAKALELQPKGRVSIQTASTGSGIHHCEQFDVGIVFSAANLGSGTPSGVARAFVTMPVLETDLMSQGIQVLIGRDILSQCLLVFHGPGNLVILNF